MKKAGLRQAELDLAKTVIETPFDCRLGKVEIEPGQYLAAGQSLFEAHGTALTEVEIQIPLDQLRTLIPPDRDFQPPVNMDAKTVQELFDFHVIVRYQSGDFRAVYASGVFGGLDPNDGRMIFFLDRIKPKMKSGKKNVMQLEKVNRELQVEVHMSPNQFLSVAKWMHEHAQKFGKKVKSSKKETSTSYIG